MNACEKRIYKTLKMHSLFLGLKPITMSLKTLSYSYAVT